MFLLQFSRRSRTLFSVANVSGTRFSIIYRLNQQVFKACIVRYKYSAVIPSNFRYNITSKVRAPNAERHFGAQNLYWHGKITSANGIYKAWNMFKCLSLALNFCIIELTSVKYHAAESLKHDSVATNVLEPSFTH
jgi:hypothetical protein